MGRRVRMAAGVLALAELIVFVLVASVIGVGWTILATLATSALGMALLARQGGQALAELRESARTRRPPGRALGDAGLIAAGGLLMLLPGFLGDVVGLLCLLPLTRPLPRAVLLRLLTARLPQELRGPVRVPSSRGSGAPAGAPGRSVVIEGQVVEQPVVGKRVDDQG